MPTGSGVIQGNYIGTDVVGENALAMGAEIVVYGNGHLIGGTELNSGNVIVGGIFVVEAEDLRIQGNTIGVNQAGGRVFDAAFGDPSGDVRRTGIWVSSGRNIQIGGTENVTPGVGCAGACNLVAGMNNSGIVIWGEYDGDTSRYSVENVTVRGNFVGATRGMGALGNHPVGIQVTNASNVVVGGNTPAARNLVIGGQTGIVVAGPAADEPTVRVQGNYVGVDPMGARPARSMFTGIRASGHVRIGGDSLAAGNVIGFVEGIGVVVSGGPVTILSNSIFENGHGPAGRALPRGGIVYVNDDSPGRYINDRCDADGGAQMPNQGQNFPILSGATDWSAGTVQLSGYLNSTPNTTFTVQFFANDACHPSGFGEGRTLIGTVQVTTDPECESYFVESLHEVPPTTTGFTATATDPLGNTSEFSNCFDGKEVVVNMADVDAPDADLEDRRCDTDSVRTGDQCTLRAALEHVARWGLDTIHFDLENTANPRIVVDSILPPIAHDLTLDGTTQPEAGFVSIDAALSEQVPSGFVVEAGNFTLRGVKVLRFSGTAIDVTSPNSTLTLSDVEISDNSGWGVRSAGDVVIGHAGAAPNPDQATVVRRNAAVGAVVGGGILAHEGSIRASGLEVSENGGPGIMAQADVNLSRVVVRDNRGYGVYSETGHIAFSGDAGEDDLRVVGNQGVGILANLPCEEDSDPPCNGVAVEGDGIVVQGNGSWGIATHGTVFINAGGEQAPPAAAWSTINDNGNGQTCYALVDGAISDAPRLRRAACRGGGVLAYQGPVQINDARIQDNGGPGVLSTGGVTLRSVDVSRNRGDGVRGGMLHLEDHLELDGLAARVSENRGHGLYGRSATGEVEGEQGITIAGHIEAVGNGRWGLNGNGLSLGNQRNIGVPGRSTVSRNGGGPECFSWDLDRPGADDLDPAPQEIPCSGGGILSVPAGDGWYFNPGVVAMGINLLDNAGPGILSVGHVNLDLANVQRNRGDGVASENGYVHVRSGSGDEVDNFFVDNAGYGIYAGADGADADEMCLEIAGAAEITGNGAWGLYGCAVILGTVRGIGHPARSTVSNNGHGELCVEWRFDGDDDLPDSARVECEGGGILSFGAAGFHDEHAAGVVGMNVDIQDNAGPGILSKDDVRLALVDVRDNLGDGVAAESGTVTVETGASGVVDNFFNGNAGHGIYAGSPGEDADESCLEIAGAAEVRDNGAWGLYGCHVIIGAVSGIGFPVRSTVSDNGHGDRCHEWRFDGDADLPDAESVECEGGGILSFGDSGFHDQNASGVVAMNVDIQRNAGPGILSKDDVRLAFVDVRENRGDGVAAEIGTVGVESGAGGAVKNFFVGNAGIGIYAGSPGDDDEDFVGVNVAGSAEVRDNGGWGVYGKGVVFGAIGGRAVPVRSTVSGNGDGAECLEWRFDGDADLPDHQEIECEGGGILAFGDPEDCIAVVMNIDIRGNAGPGVLSAGQITLDRVDVRENEADGVVAEEGRVHLVPDNGLSNRFIGNWGAGIVGGARGDSGEEGVVAEAAIEVRANRGAGVVGDGIRLGEQGGVVLPTRSVVSGNGLGGACVSWGLGGSEPPEHDAVPCDQAGLVADDGPARASNVEIVENRGDGVQAGDDVHLRRAAVNDNGGAGVVARGDLLHEQGALCRNASGAYRASGTSTFVDVDMCGDDDADGIGEEEEDRAANGGDGNADGVPDRQQAHVASFVSNDEPFTISSPVGTRVGRAQVADMSILPEPPLGVELPFGLFQFEILDLDAGGNATVEMRLPEGEPEVNRFWKFGPRPAGDGEGWYAFVPDGDTGAVLPDSRTVQLSLVDGGRGDTDRTPDGRILDPGGPAIQRDADLVVTAERSPATDVRVGDRTAVAFGVANRGPRRADGVSLALDSGQLGIEHIETDTGDCDLDLGGACALGSLEPGESVTVTLEVRPEAAGAFSVSATASYDLPDLDPVTDVFEITLEVSEPQPWVVTFEPGPAAPPLEVQASWGQTNVPMLQVAVSTNCPEEVVLDGLSLDLSGTYRDVADLTSVRLYADMNQDGFVGPDDRHLAEGVVEADEATVDLTVPDFTLVDTPVAFLVTVDIRGAAEHEQGGRIAPPISRQRQLPVWIFLVFALLLGLTTVTFGKRHRGVLVRAAAFMMVSAGLAVALTSCGDGGSADDSAGFEGDTLVVGGPDAVGDADVQEDMSIEGDTSVASQPQAFTLTLVRASVTGPATQPLSTVGLPLDGATLIVLEE